MLFLILGNTLFSETSLALGKPYKRIVLLLGSDGGPKFAEKVSTGLEDLPKDSI